MNILITGSTGFVGRNLVPSLLNEGHNVLEITRDQSKSFELFGDKTLKYQFSDDQSELQKCIHDFKPIVCIHLASYLTSLDDYSSLEKLIDTNVFFLCRVLDALKGSGLELFINTGTFAEYHKGGGELDPAYLYAATKTASRSFIRYYSKAYDFKHTTVIPYTIYGGIDSQPKIIDFIYSALDSETPIDLSLGTQVLDFIHVNDVAAFYSSVIDHRKSIASDTVFHLGTGKGTTLRELAALIGLHTGKPANINWGAKPFRLTDVMFAVSDRTGMDFWQPKIDIETGVKLFLQSKIQL